MNRAMYTPLKYSKSFEMFKVKNNLSPELVQCLFILTPVKDQIHHFKYVYEGEQSLRLFGPIVWGSMIPEKIKATFEDVKKDINVWVPESCPCKLCKDYVPNLGVVTLYK